MIFYFSGTGNTRWAAKRVASALGEEQLIDMGKEVADAKKQGRRLDYTLTDGERVGFFFPVHGWRPPTLVREFMSMTDFHTANSYYCYVVCTAGDNIGETVDIFEQLLAQKGLRMDSAISLIMPESYVGLPFMDVDKPEKEKYKKDDSARRLDQFVGELEKRTAGIRDLVRGHWPKTNSRLIGSVFERWIVTDRHFHVDTSKCIGCGKCAALCPVHDIELSEANKPHWLHNGDCLTCFSCYHHCPVRAIEFGRRTKGKGQYYYEKQ